MEITWVKILRFGPFKGHDIGISVRRWSVSYSISFKLSHLYYTYKEFIGFSHLILNAFEFTNSFEGRGCMHYSVLNSNYFQDFHKTLLKRGKWLPAALQKEFCTNSRNLSANMMRGLHSTVFKRVL
jgi:hypothetical protein